jgi:hypothetical protein
VKHAEWFNNRQASALLMEISYAQLEKALNFEEKVLYCLHLDFPCLQFEVVNDDEDINEARFDSD